LKIEIVIANEAANNEEIRIITGFRSPGIPT
jgi:hypothetical protein